MWVNGTYLVRAAAIEKAIVDAFIDVVGNSDLKPLIERAEGRLSPIVFHARFNPDEGYGSYVFPAVAPVILQQTLLFGAAVLLAARRSRRPDKMAFRSVNELLGTWSALALISSLLAGFYFGWAFVIQDVPGQATVAQLAAIAALSGFAYSAFACGIGSLFRSASVALLFLLPTSLPIFFLSGASWPLTAMPWPIRMLGETIPATHTSRVGILVNEMGAGLAGFSKQLSALLLLTCVYLMLAYLSDHAKQIGARVRKASVASNRSVQPPSSSQ